MLKPSFVNILLYLLLKYMLVYAIFMLVTNNFKMLQIQNIKNGSDLFYYLWIISLIPVINMILFSAPLFLAFKAKRRIYFLVLVGLVIVAEYFVYVYFTSQKHIDVRGVAIELIGLVVFYLCFFRSINLIFMQRGTKR
ncbi:hypothetical protein BC349_14590 [Flavihumibacter stibioxidans]|uniref:Uncharacterized protein n=1 Tax=Flavihumibacter stibioxidans TaxID=1834163 RepID=A0ABR7MB88_9BACT|nr:hypothetical protein [Flavihumibacter stibioxidans]